MDKRLLALKNLINVQSDTISHFVDLIITKRRELFTDEELMPIYIDLMYLDKASQDLKECNKDGK